MRIRGGVCVSLILVPCLAWADLNTDFATCRQQILLISSDPRSPREQYCLGLSYAFALNHKKNQAEAAKWYRKSAEQGDANWRFPLGRAYQFGIEVPQNRQEAIRWFDKAGDQGHDQANYFANHVKQRGTYVGFRNDEEHAAVVGLKLRSVLLNIEPVGHTFHSSAERVPYLRQAGRQADREEAYQRWSGRKLEYDDCMRAHRPSCSDPGPPPN